MQRRKKKEQKLCRSKLYRDSGVWQHVTVTRAFQLIKNKRCERPTVENRQRVQMLFIVKYVAAKCSRGCYLNDCANVIVSGALCVAFHRKFVTVSQLDCVALCAATRRLFSSQGKYSAAEHRVKVISWIVRVRVHVRTRSRTFIQN